MKNLILLLTAFSVLLIASCAKSVEGETNAWNRNKEKINELKVLYPSMANALTTQLSSAEAAWENANSVSGEEAKIEAMAGANRLLNSGFVSDLSDFKKKQKDLNDLVVDVTAASKAANDELSARVAIMQANSVISNTKSMVERGAQTPAEAEIVMNQVTKDLDDITKTLKKTQERFKKVEKDEKKAEAEKEEAAKPWTCNYCSKSNAADAKECGGCGAPHSK